MRQGVTLLRALPVFSVRLGLNGRSEVVETESGRAISDLKFQISNLQENTLNLLVLSEQYFSVFILLLKQQRDAFGFTTVGVCPGKQECCA